MQRPGTESHVVSNAQEAVTAISLPHFSYCCSVSFAQVQQLAREVAVLHHKQQQDVLQQHQQQLAAALAREQDGVAAAQQAELGKLREELGKLRAAAMAADPAAFGARGLHSGLGSPTASSSTSRGSSYKHAERQLRQHRRQYQEGGFCMFRSLMLPVAELGETR